MRKLKRETKSNLCLGIAYMLGIFAGKNHQLTYALASLSVLFILYVGNTSLMKED